MNIRARKKRERLDPATLGRGDVVRARRLSSDIEYNYVIVDVVTEARGGLLVWAFREYTAPYPLFTLLDLEGARVIRNKRLPELDRFTAS